VLGRRECGASGGAGSAAGPTWINALQAPSRTCLCWNPRLHPLLETAPGDNVRNRTIAGAPRFCSPNGSVAQALADDVKHDLVCPVKPFTLCAPNSNMYGRAPGLVARLRVRVLQLGLGAEHVVEGAVDDRVEPVVQSLELRRVGNLEVH
jgi:hypothetical protein